MRTRGLVAAAGRRSPSPAAARAKVLLTQEEALRLAFPGAAVERAHAFLTEEQRSAAKKLSGDEELPSALVALLRGDEGRPRRRRRRTSTRTRAHDERDDHGRRRSPEARILRVEVLSFSEPEEYLPRPRWYEQFQGKPLDDELSMKRAIRPVSGATLTARATTDAARRVLAIYRVLHPAAPASPRRRLRRRRRAAPAEEADEALGGLVEPLGADRGLVDGRRLRRLQVFRARRRTRTRGPAIRCSPGS